MDQDQLRQVFDQQAAGYDKQWAKMSPIRDVLHYLLESAFAKLPARARVLCIGVGTGAELAHLAEVFPEWAFTAVEPSGQMLAVCRQRAEEAGFAARCQFHEGYLDSLAADETYHAATCFLVSQFLLDPQARTDFFRQIASRLTPGGLLASSDLASDQNSREYEVLLEAWTNMMAGGGIPPEGIERMRKAYANDVAVRTPETVASIIKSGGFESSVQFFQAGLIHGWVSQTPS